MAKLAAVTVGRSARAEPEECGLCHLDDDDQQEKGDAGGCQRLELTVAVWMIGIRGLPGEPQPDQCHDVRRAVSERVKPVGEDADRSAELAEHDLRQRDADVQEKDAE